jgi:hypothetical protein
MAKSKKAICKAMYDLLDGAINRTRLKRPPHRVEWLRANRLQLVIKSASTFLDYCSATMKKVDHSAVPRIESDLEEYQEAWYRYIARRS